MQESPGKAREREIYYNQCMPAWLSQEQIRQGGHLVLFGHPARELKYLDAHEVPRSTVTSVERILKIYRKQLEAERLGTLKGVGLYYGEIAHYLEKVLHENKQFSSVKLDVQGSYLTQIDQAMTSVLLFCCRSPQTMVGTYSSIGRDTESIWEGLRSLVIFLAFLPEETLQLLESLSLRFERSGYNFSQHVALRDLFWIRSVWEHSFRASVYIGLTGPKEYLAFTRLGRRLWEFLINKKPRSLRTVKLLRLVKDCLRENSDLVSSVKQVPALGVNLSDFYHVLYNAQPPWSQLCYFSKFEMGQKPITPGQWLAHTFRLFLEARLNYITFKGKEYTLGDTVKKSVSMRENTRLLDSEKTVEMYKRFKPRVLELQPLSPHHVGITKTVVALRDENFKERRLK